MATHAGFTLSLDCEGLWGMADQQAVVAAGRINNAALRNTYEFVHRTLGASGLKATMAFVTCFAADPNAVRAQMATLEQLACHSPGWFAHLLPALRAGQTDGWNGNAYYKALMQAGHEMAWHGATHMPLTQQTPVAAVKQETRLAQALFADLGQSPTTIVFPRNLVGHLTLLRDAGFNTYRASPPGGIGGRIASLMNEWNVLDNRVAGKPALVDGWNVSPAGFFLNWPSGVRAMVPVAVTMQRWKSLLRSAVKQGGYVHMWFHPHNLITAPAMKMAFAEIMREVGQLVRTGDIVNLTMSQANGYYAAKGSR